MGFSIETYSVDLVGLCQKFHVRRLDVFGSAAVGHMKKSSDVDLLVEFDEQVNPRRFDNYFEFLHSLEKLFGRHVDLVESGGLRNPYFIEEVNATKRSIYAAS